VAGQFAVSASNLKYISHLGLVDLIETAVADVKQWPYYLSVILDSLRFLQEGVGFQLHRDVADKGRYTATVA
jgi:hypothetical protein